MANSAHPSKPVPHYVRAATRYLQGTPYTSVEQAVYAGESLERWLNILDQEREAAHQTMYNHTYATPERIQSAVLTSLLEQPWQTKSDIYKRLNNRFKAQQINTALTTLFTRGYITHRPRRGRIFEYAPKDCVLKSDQKNEKISLEKLDFIEKTTRITSLSEGSRVELPI